MAFLCTVVAKSWRYLDSTYIGIQFQRYCYVHENSNVSDTTLGYSIEHSDKVP